MHLPRDTQISAGHPPQVHPTSKPPGRVLPSASVSSPVMKHKISRSDQHLLHCVTKLLSSTTCHLLQHCYSKDTCKTHSPPLWTYLSTLPLLFCIQDKPVSLPPGPCIACTCLSHHPQFPLGHQSMPSTTPQCQPLSGSRYTLNQHFIPSPVLALMPGQVPPDEPHMYLVILPETTSVTAVSLLVLRCTFPAPAAVTSVFSPAHLSLAVWPSSPSTWFLSALKQELTCHFICNLHST